MSSRFIARTASTKPSTIPTQPKSLPTAARVLERCAAMSRPRVVPSRRPRPMSPDIWLPLPAPPRPMSPDIWIEPSTAKVLANSKRVQARAVRRTKVPTAAEVAATTNRIDARIAARTAKISAAALTLKSNERSVKDRYKPYSFTANARPVVRSAAPAQPAKPSAARAQIRDVQVGVLRPQDFSKPPSHPSAFSFATSPAFHLTTSPPYHLNTSTFL